MSRTAAAPSRMEILVLTSLARAPMHGYELKLELSYKHVEWWAKCEHGHLYAALARLERGKYIRPTKRAGGRSNQKVYAVTATGKQRHADALTAIGEAPDATYFDVDVFLSGCHVLDRDDALAILDARLIATRTRAAEARTLETKMAPHVPAVGRLIMEHRVSFLENELAFLAHCIARLRAEPRWGPFLGDATIEDFVKSSGVPLEKRRR
jgi:DNA-binding PadR family transcriptional regulator